METNITSQTETEAKFTVTLNEAELKSVVAHVFDELRPKVKASGFRPGKAPDKIVERELGSSYVQNEVMEHAVQQSYGKAVQELKLPVVAPPQVSLEKFVPYTELEYKATVELMPKVKLAKYQEFRIKRPAVSVEPAEAERTLEDLRRREATRLEVERAAVKGDEVNFDFAGTKDGQPVGGATAKGQTLQLGSGQFIPGFEEELIGLEPGDEKTFDIRFPKDYHEESLANQVVTFAVTLNKVTELVLPELNDEFVVKISPFKTVDELRTDILQQITNQKAETATRDYEQQVLDKLLKESDYKLPDSLVQQQLRRMRAEVEQNLASSGLDLAKYLELSNKTEDELDKEMRPEAERRVGLAMILTEVAANENLSVSGEDLDMEIGRMKLNYKDEATRAELDNPNTREEIYNHLMASKVIAKLVGYAEGK
ncbi:MAG TPA: trigger factor [Candidatus Saccharimonadia bacterium]|nr:trigger factor [Candidatus Saccharimonadia bacterium]